MTLEEKGKIMPPPLLSEFPQIVSKEIQLWNHIIAATHWYLYDTTKIDGVDFYVGKEELGHIHLDGSVHLAIDKKLKEYLLKNKMAYKFPYGNEFVQYTIKDKPSVEHAIKLFKMNYDRIINKLI